jgi:gliding motility-associated-like protein
VPAPDISVVTDEADNCTVNPVVAWVSDVSDGNTCPEIITRIYSVTDECDNVTTVTQTITVDDTTPPTASNPAPVAVECIGDVPAPDPSVVIDEADNCTAEPVVEWVTDVSDGNTCPEIITRYYSVTDECDNVATVTQIITVDDQTDPVFDTPPAGLTVECYDDVPAMTDLSWTDNCDGTGTVTGIDQSDGGTCPENITRTWSYTDACGNTASVTQIITVNDQTDPVFATPPAAISVECYDDVPAPGMLTWTDNCDGTGEVMGVDQSDGGNCPTIITRSWSYTDACGNTATVTQIITVDDTTDPVFDPPPAAIAVECYNEVPPPGMLTWTDNCDGTGEVLGIDQSDGGNCPTIITRSWTYTDACGNTSTAVQIITVDDQTDPVFDPPPAAISVECFDDVPPPGMLTWTDNCDGTGEVLGVDESDGGNCPLNITRSWSYTDACGNTTTVTQTITVDDTTLPTASDPEPIAVECIDEVPDPDPLVVTDEADNCTLEPVVAWVEDVSDGNTCPETISRYFSVTDECGNSITVTQLIIVNDITPPTASNPDPIAVQCIDEVPDPDPLVVVDEADNCTEEPVVAWLSDESDGNTCPETITRIYRITDECDNIATVVQTITVDDTIPPTASDPEPITVQCIEDVPDPDITLVIDEADNCTLEPLVEWVSDVSDGNTCPETITRSFSITDECGNVFTVTQDIIVNDDIPPTASPPPPVDVQCFDEVPDPDITIITNIADNCTGEPVVAFVADVPDGNSCPLTISRIYSVTDECGNSANVTQTITVNDDIAPVIDTPPDAISVECFDDVPAPIMLTWTDNCDGTGEVMGVDESDGGNCPTIITRYWVYTDSCGNTTTVTQSITVNDQTDPVIDTPPEDISVECYDDVPPPGMLTWTDNCDGTGEILGVDESDGSNCPTTITRAWSYTDACGNTATQTQVIIVNDQTAPVLDPAPDDVSVECFDDVPPMIDLTWTDNCDGTGTVSPTDQSDGGNCPTTIIRTWTYTDACGNTATETQIIVVNDVTSPVFETPPGDMSFECPDDVPPPTMLSWTDNCDGAGEVLGIDESDGDNCPTIITRTWTYTDACGNTSTETQIITVNDTEPPYISCPDDLSVLCNIDEAPPYANYSEFTTAGGNASDNCSVDESSFLMLNEEISGGYPGPYVITRTYGVTDLCGNLSTCVQTIDAPSLIFADITPGAPVICAFDAVQLDGNPYGGSGVYTHSWTGDGAVYLDQTDIQNPVFSGAPVGVYEVTYSVTDENFCTATDEILITVVENILPIFNVIDNMCQFSTPPELPTISLNGITGFWTPPTINTSIPGTTTYSFTPDDPSQCALPTTMDITIDPQQTPVFDPVDPMCQYADPPVLPDISLNGITGDWDPPVINTDEAGIFTYLFTPDNPAQCAVPVTIEVTINPEVTPLFEPIDPVCQYSVPPELPAVSTNGITGTWEPPTINTDEEGTFTYTFTPDNPEQCAIETTIEVVIVEEILPEFDPIGPFCQYSTAPELPDISLNAITGYWDPPEISTDEPGIFTYTFIPDDPSQCAIETTMDVTIDPEIVPQFDPVDPMCQYADPPVLPNISLNGITGNWDPPLISTDEAGTFTYTFIPDDPSQCGTETTMDVTIDPEMLPVFEPIDPVCQYSVPPELPAVSTNGITGTWDPPVINTDEEGTFTYTFTPDNPEQCAIETNIEVVIVEEILPEFDPIGPFCQYSITPELPGISLNGITGYWDPPEISTDEAGTFTYTFIPDDPSQCAIETTMDVTIDPEIVPQFDPVDPMCQYADPPVLPNISLNGITGNWDPPLISTDEAGTFTYTFIPDDPSQCGTETTMDITIDDEILPVFDSIAPMCIYSDPPALQEVSNNGITGYWNPPVIETSIPGTKIYIFTPDPDQCALEQTLEITIHELPVCGIIGSDTACPSTEGNIFSGPDGMVEYQWSIAGGIAEIEGPTNEQTVNVTVGENGGSFTLYLDISDGKCANFCENEVFVPHPPRIESIPDMVLCEGDDFLVFGVVLTDKPIVQSHWLTPEGDIHYGSNLMIPNVNPDHSGIYKFIVVDNCSCAAEEEMYLTVIPTPEPALNDGDTIYTSPGDTSLNAGSGFATYLWSTDEFTQIIIPEEEGMYWVTVTTPEGCFGTDTVYIYFIQDTIPDVILWVPNAFTPDGDGLNDTFRPIPSNYDLITSYKLMIFNRWGQFLWETEDIGEGWPGTVDGVLVPGDAYVYKIIWSAASVPGKDKPMVQAGMFISVQ